MITIVTAPSSVLHLQAIGKFMGFDALQIAKMNDCVEQTLWHFKPNSLSTGANV
jgi:hypothetical protein